MAREGWEKAPKDLYSGFRVNLGMVIDGASRVVCLAGLTILCPDARRCQVFDKNQGGSFYMFYPRERVVCWMKTRSKQLPSVSGSHDVSAQRSGDPCSNNLETKLHVNMHWDAGDALPMV